MTDEQLYLAIGLPTLINAVLIGILMAYINAKFDTARAELLRVEGVLDARLQNVEQRLKVLEEKVH